MPWILDNFHGVHLTIVLVLVVVVINVIIIIIVVVAVIIIDIFRGFRSDSSISMSDSILLER